MYHRDTFGLKIGHLVLLPLIVLVRILRLFYPSFRINIGWVYAGDKGKQRYTKVGPIDLKRLGGIHSEAGE